MTIAVLSKGRKITQRSASWIIAWCFTTKAYPEKTKCKMFFWFKFHRVGFLSEAPSVQNQRTPFFVHHIYYVRPSILSILFSLLVVTQIRGHIAGSSPPLPALRFVPCFFIARRFQLFLPSSTRVELFLLALGALSSWSFLIFANNFRISPQRDSNSRTNTSSLRGLPLNHRGDRLYSAVLLYLEEEPSSLILFRYVRRTSILEHGVAGYILPPPRTASTCLLYTSPSPRDRQKSRMPSSA